jgi:hypothetical protein
MSRKADAKKIKPDFFVRELISFPPKAGEMPHSVA